MFQNGIFRRLLILVPIIFNILDRSREKGVLFSKLQQLFQTYGKILQATILPDCRIHHRCCQHTSNPYRSIQQVWRGIYQNNINQGWIGDGVFSSDGPVWKHSRTLFKPVFPKGQYANLPGLDVHVKRLLALVPRDETTVDIQPLFQRLVSSTCVYSFRSCLKTFYWRFTPLTRWTNPMHIFSIYPQSFSSANALNLYFRALLV